MKEFYRLLEKFCVQQTATRFWKNNLKPEWPKPCPEWVYNLACKLEFKLRKYRRFFVIFLCFLPILGNSEQFNQINKDFRDKIVNAIFRAEGGNNTKHKYGIKSIKTNNPKRVCEVTVENNYLRWQKSGKTNDFISFLGNRFCPISDPNDKNKLNKNWVKNVKNILAKSP